MPYQLDTPVLAVDREILYKVDAANPQNLFSMWTVFSKCADSVQQGRRLEYICWRYWNRQTFCHEAPQSPLSTTLPKDIPSSAISDVPPLSSSVHSEDNEEVVDFTSESSPVDIQRPRIRQDSCGNRTRSPKSESFEKLVVSILDEKLPLTAPLAVTMPMAPQKVSNVSTFQRSGSTTTESSARSSEDASEVSQQASPDMPSRAHSIVKGFSPSIMPISRAVPKISPDSIDAKPTVAPKLLKKQGATSTVGGSVSSREQSSRKMRRPAAKGRMFQLGSSNSSEEEHSPKSSPRTSRTGPKTQASVGNEVTLHTIDDADVIADDSETDADDVDESAIDDDEDDSEWEDSDEVSGNPTVDGKTYFQRVPSVAQLPSRPSLLTLGLQASDRAKRLGNVASQSTSALDRAPPAHGGPALAGSPNDSDEHPLMMKAGKNTQLQRINEVPRTAAQPINAIPIPAQQAALSPRATRRHMLATELTNSLRRHIVWERQYKHSTANAVLKRRHTSHDLANLKQHPEPVYMNRAEDQNANSFNQFFSKDADSGYHAKGW